MGIGACVAIWTVHPVLLQAQVSVKEALRILSENQIHISKASELFGVKARLVASVIFVEHVMNVSWVDRELDASLAAYGLNTSLGLGQVKISTAEWIEQQLGDSMSLYFTGGEGKDHLPASKSRQDIVRRLLDPSENSKYIAAFFAAVQKRWRDVGFSIDDRPEIAATLYSTGVVKGDVEMKIPHGSPHANEFGNIALKFYNSEWFADVFPR